MKRIGSLWNKFISLENAKQAIKTSSYGKRKRRDVAPIVADIDKYAQEIVNILNSGWKHSSYVEKTITDNYKQRKIQVVPYYPDRIIHHMINKILEPILVPRMIKHTYQCIKGRGVHKAIRRTETYVNKGVKYVLNADISKFYPSVDNEILKGKIASKIKDKKFLNIVNELIDSFKGIPVGNCSSQLLGNWYLNDLDHKMLEINNSYIRYADDLVIFGSKQTVKKAYLVLKEELQKLNLKLNTSTQYYPLEKRKLEFLGFRFSKNFIRPRKKTIIRILKRIENDPSHSEAAASWFGWVKDSKSTILLAKIFDYFINNTKGFKNVKLHILNRITIREV